MREALILAGITLGIVGTVFGGDDTSPAPAAVAAAISPAPVSSVAPAAASGGTTELRRAGDGHFYAGVTLNGRPVTMLVDTGASVVALTGADARAAGLSWSPTQLAVVAQGAGGPIQGVTLQLERITLGGHEARNVSAIIVPEGLPISLLGQSFLTTIEPVRIEKDRMVLGGA